MDWAETNPTNSDKEVTVTLTEKQLIRVLIIVAEKLSRLKEIASDPTAPTGTRLVMRGQIPQVKALEELLVAAADKGMAK